MGSLDRGLLVLYSFFLTLLFLAALPAAAGWVGSELLNKATSGLLEEREFIIAIIGVIILAGVRLFWAGIKPERKRAVVFDGAHGQVRISLSAIENLVERLVSSHTGVKEVKSQVQGTAKGIIVHVKVAVTPDIRIPDISIEIQKDVKEKVNGVTGIEVQEVYLTVDSVSAKKQRVE